MNDDNVPIVGHLFVRLRKVHELFGDSRHRLRRIAEIRENPEGFLKILDRSTSTETASENAMFYGIPDEMWASDSSDDEDDSALAEPSDEGHLEASGSRLQTLSELKCRF